MKLIIFTDLDGTLLNQEDYNYAPALPVLEYLQEQEIPVIPVTSKTRAEVVGLRQEIGLNTPFIVENGSGVFVPLNGSGFTVSHPLIQDGYHQEILGCTYQEARQALEEISWELGLTLRGFGDLKDRELQALTGLSLEAVKLAKIRDFTEPFITPKQIPPEELKRVIEAKGFKVVVGDRFSHLIGAGAGKGKAVNWLKKTYSHQEKLMTIGLGNSPNDLGMLEKVDFPIIVPTSKGVHSGLTGKGWEIAPEPGSTGWAKAVTAILTLPNPLR